MREVFDFILVHYEAILSVFTLIVSIVVLILRKNPVNDLMSSIWAFSKEAVCYVECSGVRGPEQKLQNAIDFVNACLKEKYPEITIGIYNLRIKRVIESILETPQKGDKKNARL